MFFTVSLILLHIKLKKIGLTAYEYICFKDDQQERLERYEAGEISKDTYEEEERQAQEDMKRKKKSRIIHQINKENKKAYRDRIIERNKRAKEKQEKAALETKKQNATPGKTKDKSKTKKHQSEMKKEDFDDIMKGEENPQRVENYSAGPKANPKGRKANYADVEDIKVEMNGDDPKANSTKKKLNFDTIKENSEESKDSNKGSPVKKNEKLISTKKDSSKDIDDLNIREEDSASKQESDLNDRANWRMSDENREKEKATPLNMRKPISSSSSEIAGIDKASSDTNLNKASQEDEPSSKRGINKDLEKFEKAHPSEVEDMSDST